MSDNIYPFPDRREFKHVSYYELEGDLGVALKDESLIVTGLNSEDFQLTLQSVTDGAMTMVFDREQLAEFLWLSAYFLDADQKWLFDGEVIAKDY